MARRGCCVTTRPSQSRRPQRQALGPHVPGDTPCVSAHGCIRLQGRHGDRHTATLLPRHSSAALRKEGHDRLPSRSLSVSHSPTCLAAKEQPASRHVTRSTFWPGANQASLGSRASSGAVPRKWDPGSRASAGLSPGSGTRDPRRRWGCPLEVGPEYAGSSLKDRKCHPRQTPSPVLPVASAEEGGHSRVPLRPLGNSDDIAAGSCAGRTGFTSVGKRGQGSGFRGTEPQATPQGCRGGRVTCTREQLEGSGVRGGPRPRGLLAHGAPGWSGSCPRACASGRWPLYLCLICQVWGLGRGGCENLGGPGRTCLGWWIAE